MEYSSFREVGDGNLQRIITFETVSCEISVIGIGSGLLHIRSVPDVSQNEDPQNVYAAGLPCPEVIDILYISHILYKYFNYCSLLLIPLYPILTFFEVFNCLNLNRHAAICKGL